MADCARDTRRSDARGLPDSDCVAIWLSQMIQLEFRNRGVFPECRPENAIEMKSTGTALFHIDQRLAKEMLTDGYLMWSRSPAGLKNAYRGVTAHLERGIEDAAVRRKQLEAAQPVRLETYRGDERELWRGTKQQLVSLGITLPGPYPGEPGGAKRREMTRDHRQFKVWVKSAKDVWPGLFYAEVTFPSRKAEERRFRAVLAEQRRSVAVQAATERGWRITRNDSAFLGFMRTLGLED